MLTPWDLNRFCRQRFCGFAQPETLQTEHVEKSIDPKLNHIIFRYFTQDVNL